MSRWKAAGIHLSISLAIGLVIGALLFGVWYPPPYFHAAGADVLVVLLVSVDLTLGPLLTLIVFKSGKKGLKFDLSLIGFVQAVALVYGLSVVLESRPVFLVAAVDRFTLVSANDIDAKDLDEGGKPEFRSLSWTGPRIVGVALPTGKDRNDLVFSSINGGKDVDKLPKYYVDYTTTAPELLARAKPIDALKIADPAERDLLADAIRKTGETQDQLVWVPLMARKANLVMLLDRKTGNMVRAVGVNPWK